MRISIRFATLFTLWLARIAILLCLTGCQGPVVPGQDTLTVFPQVHLTSYSLRGKITIQGPIVNRVADGQLQVTVPVRNMTGGRLYLEYQYYFLNQEGVQVEEDSGWNTLRLPPYSLQQIQFTSLTAEADNFDLDMRRLP